MSSFGSKPTPPTTPDPESPKQTAPAALRNLAPIQEVLARFLPNEGHVLELASGTGEQIVAHARAFPHLTWVPSEPSEARRASISAYAAEADLPNLLSPRDLDACARGWAKEHGPADVVLVVNLLHLITEADMAVLLDEATQALTRKGIFAVYGPFLREGVATSSGDAAFNEQLQARNLEIGLKDLGVVASVLEALQLRVTTHRMPANNIMLIARKP